jgi:hypothetical protein
MPDTINPLANPLAQAIANALLFDLGDEDLMLAALVALVFAACGLKTLWGATPARWHWPLHRP